MSRSVRFLLAAGCLALTGCAPAPGSVLGFGFSLPLVDTASTASASPAGVPVAVAGAAAPTPSPTSTPAPASGGGGSGGGGSSAPAAPPPPAEPQEVTTFAGSPEAGFADGAPGVARFNFPQGLARGADGSLYVADRLNHRIRKVAPDGTVSTVAGTGAAGFADGPGTGAQFDEPTGVAVASDGTLYVSDSWNHRVRRIATDGTVSTLAGAATPGTDDGTGSAALFDHPSAIALGPDGALYVADEFAQTIRKVTAAGVVTTLAGDGYSKGHADGTGGAARLTFPAGLAVGADGTVYVSEKDACYLRRITAAGVVSTLNDLSAYRCGFGDGDLREARVNNAIGLAVAADGSLLVADTYNGDIRRIRFDQAGNEVSTYAGADPGYRNGSRALSRFEGPQAVVEDDQGVLYVADAHSIRRIQP